MTDNKLKKTIEAILFVAGQPVSLTELIKITKAKESEIVNSLNNSKENFENLGLKITENQQSYQMVSDNEVSEVVDSYLQGQLREKLSAASLETLAIIAYKQPISRVEIEAIRGVNSQYTLRLLQQRGLIEKKVNNEDSRVNIYQTTHEFLHHLGLNNSEDLPEFEKVTQDLTSALE